MTETSTYNQILLAVVGLVQAAAPGWQVVIGALPPDEALSVAVGAGGPVSTWLQKAGKVYELDLVLNGKSADAETVSDTLNDVHVALTDAITYPQDDSGSWSIANIETTATPNYIGVEENKQFLYGSGLTVRALIVK